MINSGKTHLAGSPPTVRHLQPELQKSNLFQILKILSLKNQNFIVFFSDLVVEEEEEGIVGIKGRGEMEGSSKGKVSERERERERERETELMMRGRRGEKRQRDA